MSRLLSRWNREELETHHHHLVDRAVREAAPIEAHTPSSFTFPEPQNLRGIPAIGRGVTGAIPGTVPHSIRPFLLP